MRRERWVIRTGRRVRGNDWTVERNMFFQRAVRICLVLVFLGILASLLLALVPSARSQGTQQTAIGPDAADALARMGKTL
jgi:hypothetical protein